MRARLIVLTALVLAAWGMQRPGRAEEPGWATEQARQVRAERAREASGEAVSASSAPEDLGLSFEVEEYPMTDGSTSANPLGILVAARLVGAECQWCRYRTGWGLGSGAEQVRLVPVVRKTPRVRVAGATLLPGVSELELHPVLSGRSHTGTHGAYERLIHGEVDLIYECRPPSADERKLMEEKGVELELTPIALDAFVFLRHRDNPVEGLTVEQIKGMYTGEVKTWAPAGGEGEVHAYVRNRNSGSQETMQSVVMGDLEITAGRDAVAHTMRGPYEQLPTDPQGIGFTFFYYNEWMSPNPRVEVLAVEDVMPSRETIASGAYRWVTPVYAVTRKDLAVDAPAAKVRDWLATPAGQAVVAESGYVPVHTVPRHITAGELRIRIARDGTIAVGETELTACELADWLTCLPPTDCEVVLTADRETAFAHVAAVFEAVRAAGVTEVLLSAGDGVRHSRPGG